MEDLTDDRPIRIRYFAAFVLKESKTKERIGKYKKIYRDYQKYKDIVASYNIYDVSTEEKYKDSIKTIGISRIKLVDEIYEKGNVISESQILL